MWHRKKKTKQRRKTGSKTTDRKFDFNEQRISKNRKIKDFEVQKIAMSNYSRTEKSAG
jgi:hypothetical protein